MRSKGTILVVEQDPDWVAALLPVLEGERHEVLFCPGPSAPDFVCLGGRGQRCPLAAAADVVVLDLDLDGDLAMTGTSGWELLLYYLGLGKRVIALAGEGDVPRAGGDVAVVRRPARVGSLVTALRGFEAAGHRGG